jgi:holo-[acyl-carrier protein] synthase
MRIPFPLSFSVGTDIVLRSRITRFCNAGPSKLQHFASKFLHQVEVDELSRRFPEWREAHCQASAKQHRIVSWLAGRWAAKEAAKKAWDASILSFKDLRVEVSSDNGDVQVVCAIESPTTHDQIEQAAKLSISHDGDYAIAVVVATPLHPTIKSELGRRKAEAEIIVKT